jgi:hypothetical protein
VYPVYPTGTVFHPVDRRRTSSLDLPLVFGRPVIVTERFIHIFVKILVLYLIRKDF